MMYLIGQLAGWLLLAAAFAALAGWGFAARAAAPAEAALRRDRMRLADDLALIAGGGAPANDDDGATRELDSVRRLADINIGRIAELERHLAATRATADEHASRAAELERELERRDAEGSAPAAANFVDVESQPTDDGEADAVALQGWRLRYFEQRVRYLESLGANAQSPATLQAAVAAPETAEPPLAEWRARVAEASAAQLADELRARAAPLAPADEDSSSPFAANAGTDVLLRWRMLYLERRAAHLQSELDAARQLVAAPVAEPAVEAAPDPDRWKWRARYLEARVRHLDKRLAQRPALAPLAAPIGEEDEAVHAPPSTAPAEKPPVLPSPRHGAPDDLRLIEGVSAMRQSSLNALGIWHFDQIAAWTPANVAWIDRYLRLRGGVGEDEWIEQAADLARDGPVAARRVMEDEDV